MNQENSGVMARQAVRLFCSLMLLLRSTEVFTAPATGSIMEVMKKDLADCKMLSYVVDAPELKSCNSMPFPKDDVKLSYKNFDTFLCLGAYESIYRLCQPHTHFQTKFNDNVSFKYYIETLYPKDEEKKVDKFCNTIVEVSPVSQRAKPFVSQLNKYLKDKCDILCFDLDKRFQPLCAFIEGLMIIGEVSKTTEISKDVGQQTVEKTTNVESVEVKSAAKTAHTVPQDGQEETSIKKAPAEQAEDKQSVLKNDQALSSAKDEKNPDTGNAAQSKTPKDEPQTAKSSSNENATERKKQTQKEPAEATKSKVKSEEVQPEKPEGGDPVGPMPDVAKDTSAGGQVAHQSNEDHGDVPETVEKSKIDPKPLPEETKTSTLSEDTQDHDPERQDYTPMEGIQFPDDVDSDIDQQDPNDQKQNMPEQSEQREVMPQYHNSLRVEEESHFFMYFMIVSIVCIAGYIGYHNKQKVLAIVLEGRRSRSNRGRRRPSTASYRKLDCTLEEAVTSQCNANVTHVIY